MQGGFVRDSATGALVISGGAGGLNVADSKNQKLRRGVSETFSRLSGLVSASTLTSGTLRLSGLMYFQSGVAVTSLGAYSGPGGATTPTNQWFCVVRQSDLTVLAVTADDTTTAWAGNAKKELAISAGPWVPAQDEWCFFGLMVAAATPPPMYGQALGNVGPAADAPAVSGNSTAGLTAPITVGTVVAAPTGGSHAIYGYAA